MDRPFLELLPWYANGTLAEADRAQIDTVLRTEPRAATELAWLQQLQQRVQADAPEVSDEIGLDRTLRRIHAESALESAAVEKAAQARGASAPRIAPVAGLKPARQPKLLAGVLDWFSGMRLSPTFAMAALVIVVQAGFIFRMATTENDYEQIRSLPGAAPESGQLFRVAFKPETRESEIRMLLIKVRGNIESGPGQLGDYYVRVPGDAAEATGTELQASPIVDNVFAVDAVPPRGH